MPSDSNLLLWTGLRELRLGLSLLESETALDSLGFEVCLRPLRSEGGVNPLEIDARLDALDFVVGLGLLGSEGRRNFLGLRVTIAP